MRKIYKLALTIVLVVAVFFVLRFVIGGNEDTWLCSNGQWVKHGNPSAPMPASGCSPVADTHKTNVTMCALGGKSMDIGEARQIARSSECGDAIKENYFCNPSSGTWWIDLNLTKKGCSPACVVNVQTKKAEINWRCTGLIQP